MTRIEKFKILEWVYKDMPSSLYVNGPLLKIEEYDDNAWAVMIQQRFAELCYIVYPVIQETAYPEYPEDYKDGMWAIVWERTEYYFKEASTKIGRGHTLTDAWIAAAMWQIQRRVE